MARDPGRGQVIGSGYFDDRDRELVERRLVRWLEAPGYDVTLAQHAPAPTAA